MFNRLILTLRVFITNRQSGHTRKTCLYQKKLLIGTEHQNNIEAQCSAGWTSETRLAFVPFGPLQLRSNVFVGFLVSFHRLIGLVFERINRRDLLPICYLHVFHVFDVADDIWVTKRYLWWTAALVLNSIELLSLLRPLHLSLRFFLFFSLPAPAWTASTSQIGWSSAVCALAEWALNFASAGELFFPYGLHRKIESVEWVVGRIRSLHRKKLLTWDEGNRIESVPPVVWDFNSFSGYGVVRHRITLIVRMLDKSLQVIWLKRVQNVEHVSAIW